MLEINRGIDRQSYQFWQDHLKKWSKSELGRDNNLKATKFTYWKSKFNRKNLPKELPGVTLLFFISIILHDQVMFRQHF